MRHALELGVNWIDTAAVYGLEVVGRLLRELPVSGRPLIFTKCELVWDEQSRMAEPQRVRPESIRRECEASLRRLGVERLDLYQFHWPDETGTPVEDSWEEMVKLIDEGKVRLGGVSNFDVPSLERRQTLRHVDSLQPPFSLMNRDAAASEISSLMASSVIPRVGTGSDLCNGLASTSIRRALGSAFSQLRVLADSRMNLPLGIVPLIHLGHRHLR
jgi:aryl-alcohol dehydrogenase-like predicted oxidoreductase